MDNYKDTPEYKENKKMATLYHDSYTNCMTIENINSSFMNGIICSYYLNRFTIHYDEMKKIERTIKK